MSSGFVSSSQLDEERMIRLEEWKKVRKESDPLDAPEAEVCNKSLFEQLQINKEKKDSEFQEVRSLKNLVRGIDEDESQFLSMVNDIQKKDEKAKKKEEEELITAMKEAKGRISIDLPPQSSKVRTEGKEIVKSRQARIIGSLIKRKNTVEDESEEKRAKMVTMSDEKKGKEEKEEKEGKEGKEEDKKDETNEESEERRMEESATKNGIGGLVEYGSDSDDECD